MRSSLNKLIEKEFVGKILISHHSSPHKITEAFVDHHVETEDTVLRLSFAKENGVAIMPINLELDEEYELGDMPKSEKPKE